MPVLEVCLHDTSAASKEELLLPVLGMFDAQCKLQPIHDGQLLDLSSIPNLATHVRYIRVCEVEGQVNETQVFVHQIFDDEPAEETTEGGDGETVRPSSTPAVHHTPRLVSCCAGCISDVESASAGI